MVDLCVCGERPQEKGARPPLALESRVILQRVERTRRKNSFPLQRPLVRMHAHKYKHTRTLYTSLVSVVAVHVANKRTHSHTYYTHANHLNQ